MAVIKCKMCGGDLALTEGQSVAECEFCGSRQTVPVADNEKKLSLFARANRLRLACEFDKAAGIYESIVAEFPEEAEAYWGLVLCKYGIEYVDDPGTGKKIPTCHRSDFDSLLDDNNYELSMEYADMNARRVYREEARQIEELRKGIIAVSSKEEPYDIFICYKETDEKGDRTLDSVLAQDLYQKLTQQKYRVFFARITLEDKLGQEYEPYIFAALNSAKVMLVVGTDYEYFDAVWVKNEWSRYLQLMEKDKTKYLIPCYKGIDAYDMPREFSKLQAQDLGKLGADQDLLRGIEKLIPRQSKQETVVIQQHYNDNTLQLLRRGNMALEDGEWNKADEFFEQVLNQNAECAEAYLGKFLAGKKRAKLKDQFAQTLKMTENGNMETKTALSRDEKREKEILEARVLPNYLTYEEMEPLLEIDLTYRSCLSSRQTQAKAAAELFKRDKNLSKAVSFASGDTERELDEAYQLLVGTMDQRVAAAQKQDEDNVNRLTKAYEDHLAEVTEKVDQMRHDVDQMRAREYRVCGEYLQKITTVKEFEDLIQRYEKIGDYQEALDNIAHCRSEIARIQKEEAEEAERQRKEAEAKEEARVRKNKIIISIVAAIAAIALGISIYYTNVVLPKKNYAEAEAQLAAGNRLEAAMLFGLAEDYEDAASRSLELWDEFAKRSTFADGGSAAIAIQEDGTVLVACEDGKNYANAINWTDLVAVDAGNLYVSGLRADGTVVSASNSSGTGFEAAKEWDNIVSISTGYYSHLLGLKSDGTVVAAGSSQQPELNTGKWKDIVAISAGGDHSVGLKKDGTVVAVGDNDNGQCNVDSWTDIVAISAGYDHTVGLKSDGTVVATDYYRSSEEYRGQCDVSEWKDIVAVSAGSYYTLGLKKDGTVVVTNFVGKKDLLESFQARMNVGGLSNVVAISAHSDTLALLSNGTMVALGELDDNKDRINGWLDIRMPDISLKKLEEMRQQEANDAYFKAMDLQNQGDLAGAAIHFGKAGDYLDAKSRAANLWNRVAERKTLASSYYQVLAITNDGGIFAIGKDALIGEARKWSDVVAVAAGQVGSMALKADGTVALCASSLYSYSLDSVNRWTDIVSIDAYYHHYVGLRSDGTVLFYGSSEYDKAEVAAWSDIIDVAVGADHTVGLRADGTVVAAGDNSNGQCNVGDWMDIVAIACGNGHTIGLKADGTVLAVGDNYDGQCETAGWTDIVAISGGNRHTLGLRSDGTVVAVGDGDNDQLYVQSWTDVVAIEASNFHSFGLKSDGTVFAVGDNGDYGHLNARGWKNIQIPD